MSVVSVVLTFLVNVYVIEEFTSSVISVFALALFNFSRILSKIMIVPLIEYPTIVSIHAICQATEIEIAANHILQTKKKLNSIMAENCGKTVEELTAATDRDNWLTAQEALEFGLVDKVIDKR